LQETAAIEFHGDLLFGVVVLRGDVDSLADSRIRPAAAKVGAHGGVDLRVRRLRRLRKQRRCRQNLSRLAIAALRNIHLLPRKLNRVRAVGRESFDGRHSIRANVIKRGLARPDRLPSEQDGAGAAVANAAAKFRALQVKDVAQRPE